MSRQASSQHGKSGPGAPLPGHSPANGSGRDPLGRLRAMVESLRHQLAVRRRNTSRWRSPSSQLWMKGASKVTVIVSAEATDLAVVGASRSSAILNV